MELETNCKQLDQASQQQNAVAATKENKHSEMADAPLLKRALFAG